MFHSVGNSDSDWNQHWLSVSLNHFESFCQYLQRNNYRTVFLDEWYESSPSSRNNKCIALTFDDGYLDNWVYAYPLLQKYGLKGTIFVNPEFVDPSENVRYNLEDVWKGTCHYDVLESLGFLNVKEIQTMDRSGIMDIQNHSMSHNFYFNSDELIDYYEGQDDYYWLAWIERPDRKPFWITEDQKDYISEGYPIFQYGRALGLRRFFPSEHFIESFISEYWNSKGSLRAREKLFKLVADYKKRYDCIGRYENDQELGERYRYEIFESKRVLEEILNKQINFICWPGGGYNDLSIRLSIEAGYKASTVSSWDKQYNTAHSGPYKRIKRFGLNSFLVFKDRRYYIRNRKHLIHLFLSKSGNKYYKNMLRFKKYLFVVK